jgi:hypothetical protein
VSKARKTRQHSLSFKVSGEEKQAFAMRCAKAGMTQSEMLERLVLGRITDEQPLAPVARDHISLIHHLRVAIAAGTPINSSLMDELLSSTRKLITVVRASLEP